MAATGTPPIFYVLVGKREPSPLILAEFELPHAEAANAVAAVRASLDGGGGGGGGGGGDGNGEQQRQQRDVETGGDGDYGVATLDKDGLWFAAAFGRGKDDAETERRRARTETVVRTVADAFAARIGTARARGVARRYAFNAEFAPVLRRLLEAETVAAASFVQSGKAVEEDAASTAAVKRLASELDKAKAAAQKTIETAAARGTKLMDVAGTSESLANASTQFRGSATALRRQLWWDKIKVQAMIVGVCAVLILIIVWAVRKK